MSLGLILLISFLSGICGAAFIEILLAFIKWKGGE